MNIHELVRYIYHKPYLRHKIRHLNATTNGGGDLSQVLRASLGPVVLTRSSWAALCDVRWICSQRPAWCGSVWPLNPLV